MMVNYSCNKKQRKWNLERTQGELPRQIMMDKSFMFLRIGNHLSPMPSIYVITE